MVGLDADPTVLENLLAEGRRVVYGDAEDSELWGGLPLERIKGVILTVPAFEVRCAAISQLRKRGFTGQIGTICYYRGEERELTRLGANLIIHPLMRPVTSWLNKYWIRASSTLSDSFTCHLKAFGGDYQGIGWIEIYF